MSSQKTLLTADEFYLFCCRSEGRYELVSGEVVELAPVNEEHGNAAFNISGAFYVYSRRYGVGKGAVETGYRLRENPDTVRGPDVSFNLGLHRQETAPRTGFVSGAPDIAVEVVSPSNTGAEMERKVRECLEAGSQRIWLVYPATSTSPARVLVRRADGTDDIYSGDDTITDEELLPGFSLPLSDIFD